MTSHVTGSAPHAWESLLTRESAHDIDPITYEVIRHNLWSINEEHAATIVKISGSPIVVFGHDFNPSILTEDGEWVFFGPYIQYLNAAGDAAVQWILENRSANPGINDGDMFLTNDPWVGSNHQPDVTLLCPVFWEGKIFCWVTNTMHQYDLGGNTPGSFCPSARDVFDEPSPIPPLKIVEGGALRQDLEELYLRRSRMPYLVALDLRAEIAGNNVARERILHLIRRYGAATVKGAMRKIISDSEKAFTEKLAALPDGIWREHVFLEVALPGDRKTYKCALAMEKRGTELTFRNAGSDPQTGAINLTFIAWRGAIQAVILPFFLYDQMYAVGGALRHIHFEPTPGTVTVANFPAAVSCSPAFGIYATIVTANNCVAKLVAADPEQRSVITCNAMSQWPIISLSGIDQWGKPYGTILMDPMACGTGAFIDRDGVSTGGFFHDPMGISPNIEHNEFFFPILYLSRSENTDAGGAGKFRGGNSAVISFIPHGTDRIEHTTASCGAAVPATLGLFGGYPGCTNSYRMWRSTDVRERLEAGELITEISAAGGHEEPVPSKASGIVQGPSDIYQIWWNGGAGYGDPLERTPELVERDVHAGDISRAAARNIYGVVLSGDPPQADVQATEETRTMMRQNRKRRSTAATDDAGTIAGEATLSIGDALEVVDTPQGRWFRCAKCGHGLGPVTDNYKDHCLRYDGPLQEAGPLIGDPKRYVDDEMVFRQFFCPGCVLLIETEIARREESPLRDVELH